MASKVLSIMFTDIKGFTERTSATSREDLVGLLKKHDSLLIPVIGRFSGTIVKTIGDAFLVTFDSPTNAVLCGVMIQHNLREFNAGRPDAEKIFIRVSVNMGEVEVRDGDVFGEAVNIAARLEGVTEASEIYFTESVYLAMNKAEVPSSEVGSFRLKGIPEAIKVYRVIQDTNSESFQKIIERLRGDAFNDVALPSAGGPFAAGAGRRFNPLWMILGLAAACAVIYAAFFMKTAARDLARCEAFLAKGEIMQASLLAEDMLEKYPADIKAVDARMAVLEASVAAEKKSVNFQRAHELIDEVRARFKWPGIDAVEKKLLLDEADFYAEKENYRGVDSVYYELGEKFPGDAVVRASILKNCSAGSKMGPTSRAVNAALAVAESSTGEASLEGVVVKTLVAGLKTNDFKSKTADRIRAALKPRFASVEADIRKLAASDNYEERANAVALLKECGKLGKSEEFVYHLGVLTSYGSSGSDSHIRAAVEYFDALASAGHAEEVKAAAAAAGTNIKITSVPILSTGDYLSGSVAVTIAKVFAGEARDAIPVWASKKDDYWLRANAYEMLKAAGRLGEIDLWAFHAHTLESFDPSFIPDHFVDAASYFGGFAGKERAPDAKAELSKCLERVKKHREECAAKNYNDYEARAKLNIERLETELAKF